MAATFRQRRQHAKALRSLRRLIDEAPTVTGRNDLLAVAARDESWRGQPDHSTRIGVVGSARGLRKN